MSYDIRAKFVNIKTKEIVATGSFNVVKNLLERNYSLDMEHVISTSKTDSADFPNVTEWYTKDYIDSYKKEALKIEGFKDKIKLCQIPGGVEPSYLIDDVDFEAYKEALEPYKLSRDDVFKRFVEYKDKKTEEYDYFALNVRKNEPSRGQWFKLGDFVNALPIYKNEYEKSLEKYWKLKVMKDTPAYFEMSDSARSRFFDELQFAEEDLEYAQSNYESINKVIDILSFFNQEMCKECVNELGLSYTDCEDKGEIEVFLSGD